MLASLLIGPSLLRRDGRTPDPLDADVCRRQAGQPVP